MEGYLFTSVFALIALIYKIQTNRVVVLEKKPAWNQTEIDSINKKIDRLENRPICNTEVCNVRLINIEREQSILAPTIRNVENILAKIDPLVDLLLADYQERMKK